MPLPIIKSPVVVIGDKALNPALAVVWPVPPLAMGSVPVTPVVKGNPVALVNVTLVGVPNIGVTNVGEVLNTTLPVPVEVVTPVPPLATANVPAKVIAPVVAVDGVNPVVPALNEDTPPLTVAQVPSPRKYVVIDGVPVTMPTAVAELKRLLLDAVAPAGKVTAVLAVAVND